MGYPWITYIRVSKLSHTSQSQVQEQSKFYLSNGTYWGKLVQMLMISTKSQKIHVKIN